MKIRNRLSIQFTIIVASILLLFSTSVYYSAFQFRKNEFRERLLQKAQATAHILVEYGANGYAMKEIEERNSVYQISTENVIIFDDDLHEFYRSNPNDTTSVLTKTLMSIRDRKQLYVDDGDFEMYGTLVFTQGKNYLVVARAADIYGKSKLRNLRLALLSGFFLSAALTLISGWIYSGKALAPISRVIDEADSITGYNLSKRLGEGNRKDEVAHLAITFNQMLDRIEKAFQVQKSFIANASHELRTPLTAITGQLEVAMLHKRDTAEYEALIASLLEDIRNLNNLANGLLSIAQSDMEVQSMRMKVLRIDEVLWESRQEVLKHHPDYSVNLCFPEAPTEESEWFVEGVEPLLKVAILNLMDNACKYSASKKVDVTVSHSHEKMQIDFADNGIGIPSSELEKIFEPFYRASNAQKFSGHGLGLALTRRTIEMHEGKISVHSDLNAGTTIRLELPAMVA